MVRYYTRACNFYYGKKSKILVKNRKAFALGGNNEISFDKIEIVTTKSKKIVSLNEIRKLPEKVRSVLNKDIKEITKSRNFQKDLNFKSIPKIMGVLNITPDSFSDGGKYLNDRFAIRQMNSLFNNGAHIVDIGGESTRPGSKAVSSKIEWRRLKNILKKIKKRKLISLDTRKSDIMEKGIKLGVKLINDVSGLSFDQNTLKVLKKYNTPFVLQHSLGTPAEMQKNPKYKNVLLDIYDFFENKIKLIKSFGIKHNNIILDPGIGFGKNLKHNMTIIKNISIYHSLGFPILLGMSRKRFIKDLSKNNDSNKRIGGTVSSTIFAMMQGVQLLRVHDVNEINQSIKVFKALLK